MCWRQWAFGAYSILRTKLEGLFFGTGLRDVVSGERAAAVKERWKLVAPGVVGSLAKCEWMCDTMFSPVCSTDIVGVVRLCFGRDRVCIGFVDVMLACAVVLVSVPSFLPTSVPQ
jgi:hypothetical protein